MTRVSISEDAKALSSHLEEAGESHKADGCESCASLGKAQLSDSDREKVKELKARDSEVRRHEQAHLAAAGGHATGGASYETERGPDGKQYAVGGHVGIDTSAVSGDPAATVRKAETVRRAALAPAEPSSQDQRVAAKATAMAAKARREMASESDAPVDKPAADPVVSNARALAGYAARASTKSAE